MPKHHQMSFDGVFLWKWTNNYTYRDCVVRQTILCLIVSEINRLYQWETYIHLQVVSKICKNRQNLQLFFSIKGMFDRGALF
jgi:hypothetical protein